MKSISVVLSFSFLVSSIYALPLLESSQSELSSQEIFYLIKAGRVPQAIERYLSYKNHLEKHSYDLLKEMGLLILSEAARSSSPDEELLFIYGTHLAGFSETPLNLEKSLYSDEMAIQHAALFALSHYFDRESSALLAKTTRLSSFWPIQVEAAYHLAQKREEKATALIEGLMQRLPYFLHTYFPELFAQIGTPESINLLKSCIRAPSSAMKCASTLAACRFHITELLPYMKMMLTHSDISEQEVSSFAMGSLKDTSSIPQLEKLSKSSFASVRLAASFALTQIGYSEAQKTIEHLASRQDLFAITLLGTLENTGELLQFLMKHPDPHVKFNAALALLHQRDARSFSLLEDFLCPKNKELSIEVHHSLGGVFTAYKLISSLKHKQKEQKQHTETVTLSLKEEILRKSIECDETSFLRLARKLFDHKEYSLVPLLTALLENLKTPHAIELLKKEASRSGAPLIRMYCNLSLMRLKEKGPYEDKILQWLHAEKKTLLIRFESTFDWKKRDQRQLYQMTADQKSRLILEILSTFAANRDAKSIDLFLSLLKESNPKNRPALAGLLLQSMQ